jgi:prophage antirepressor-like protein
MGNNIQLFSNQSFGNVRVVMRNNEPWFVAKDICESLGLTDVSASCARLDDDEKVVVSRPELSELFSESSNTPTMTLISESGFYTLVMRSNKPEAKEFRKWVTSEVLPSIRKSGVYATDDFIQKTIDDPDWAISILQQVKFEREQKELALRQRDDAIRTKAWISTKRESTCMNEVKRFKTENHKLATENEDLRTQVGDAKNFKAVKCIPWLREFFAYINDKQWNTTLGQIGTQLKRICLANRFDYINIPDPNWGEIKAYDIRAIEIFKARLLTDKNYMAKYRI